MTAPIIERAARAFYDRCPTEFAVGSGGAIIARPWDDLTKGERFHVIAGMRAATEVLRAPTDAMCHAGWRAPDKHFAHTYPDDMTRQPGAVWKAMLDVAIREIAG